MECKWTKVEEALPPKTMKVAVVLSTFDNSCKTVDVGEFEKIGENGSYVWHVPAFNIMDKILYWCPIPDMPE